MNDELYFNEGERGTSSSFKVLASLIFASETCDIDNPVSPYGMINDIIIWISIKIITIAAHITQSWLQIGYIYENCAKILQNIFFLRILISFIKIILYKVPSHHLLEKKSRLECMINFYDRYPEVLNQKEPCKIDIFS